jgi:hypothetical protein
MTQSQLDNYCLSAETIGRQKFIKFLHYKGINQIKEADQHNHYDIAFTACTCAYIAEIKQRSDRYAACTDMLLEVSKYCNLKNEAKQNKAIPVYVNVYDSDPLIKAVNLNSVSINQVYKQVLQSTNYTCYNKEKLVTYITDYKEYY